MSIDHPTLLIVPDANFSFHTFCAIFLGHFLYFFVTPFLGFLGHIFGTFFGTLSNLVCLGLPWSVIDHQCTIG